MVPTSTELEQLIVATDALKVALEEAIKVSTRAIGVEHTGRQNRALYVFSKLIAHTMSLELLVRTYFEAPAGAALLDHSSIAALGRTVIDASVMTMYISEPTLTQDEWDLRRNVLFLHDLTNRKRFLTAMRTAAERNVEFGFFENYEQIKRDLKSRIKILAGKIGLKGSAAELANGQKVYIQGLRGAAREAGWNVDTLEFYQSYLSNWVHSYPVSFIRADQHEISFSEPSRFQLGFSATVLEVARDSLDMATTRMSIFTGSINSDPVGPLL